MSALTDSWLATHSASVQAQNLVLDLESSLLAADEPIRSQRIAVFLAEQAAQISDLDAKIKALSVLFAQNNPPPVVQAATW